jgi:zinc transporter, ZIP family
MEGGRARDYVDGCRDTLRLDTASPRTIAFVLAFAGGAILTMLADKMMPEAFEHGGKLVGLATTLGFALAFAISALE